VLNPLSSEKEGGEGEEELSGLCLISQSVAQVHCRTLVHRPHRGDPGYSGMLGRIRR